MRATPTGNARRSLQFARQLHHRRATKRPASLDAQVAAFNQEPAPAPPRSQLATGRDTAPALPTGLSGRGGRAGGDGSGSDPPLSQEAHSAAVDIAAILLRAALERSRTCETTAAQVAESATPLAGEAARSTVMVRQSRPPCVAPPATASPGRD